MGVYDQSARYAGTTSPGFVVHRLRPLGGVEWVYRRGFDTHSVPLPGGPDRDADLVLVADDPDDAEKPWLLIFEMQSRFDPDKVPVLFLETMVFRCHAKDTDREGGEFLPVPVFVYLQPPTGPSNLDLRTPTNLGLTGDPVVWNVAGDSAAETLRQVAADEVSWGAMFWIPLMAGVDDDAIKEWIRLRDLKVPPESRAGVVAVALTFAELVGKRRDWERAMEGVNMTESPFINEFIAQEEMRATRSALVRVLKNRLPAALSPDVQRAIADQPSLPLLLEWLDAASTSETAEDFVAVLKR